jgi:hypothetical protein
MAPLKPAKQSSLMNLPLEIREKIWGYALDDDDKLVRIPLYRKAAKKDKAARKLARTTPSKLGLLLTSKHIYYEAIRPFYRNNYFYFPSAEDFKYFVDRDCLHSDWKKHLKHLILGINRLALVSLDPEEELPTQSTEMIVQEELRQWGQVFMIW